MAWIKETKKGIYLMDGGFYVAKIEKATRGEDETEFITQVLKEWLTKPNAPGKWITSYNNDIEPPKSSGGTTDTNSHGTSSFPKPQVTFIPSPNQNSRNNTKIELIVLHYTTAPKLAGTIEWFKNSASQVSAHFIVDKDGEIVQMVNEDKRAWHARNFNSQSIGIEHVSAGEKMTPDQEAASVNLIKYLLSAYNLKKGAIKGHQFLPNSTDCPSGLFGEKTEAALNIWVDKHFSEFA